MRRLLALAVLLLLTAAPARAERTVVDSAGRSVAVPDRIGRVFAAGPPASVLVYALAPDRLTGWPRALRPEERAYIAPPYRDLPELGRLTGRGDTANLEVVLRTEPDLIVDFGSLKDTYVSLADRVQDQTGIPYLLIDGSFAATPDALRLLGGVLGVDARAGELAAYAERLLTEVDAAVAPVPEGERPRVYLARGPSGLETGLKGSINAEILERAGGVNVAVDPSGARKGIARLPIEQVLVWNPDAVVTWDERFYASVDGDPFWGGVAAVQAGRVYLSPTAPFGWIDRPPSLNRLIGLAWLANLLHPDRFPLDLRKETRTFYRLFYQVEPSESDLDALLAGAKGKAP
ncbi:MAG: iron ABC transporter substrate-binding protein [Geminicoccaceae bacterium]|nr:iron ABC transporter substrate-binding protein [Geminicoccaceae bacterium]